MSGSNAAVRSLLINSSKRVPSNKLARATTAVNFFRQTESCTTKTLKDVHAQFEALPDDEKLVFRNMQETSSSEYEEARKTFEPRYDEFIGGNLTISHKSIRKSTGGKVGLDKFSEELSSLAVEAFMVELTSKLAESDGKSLTLEGFGTFTLSEEEETAAE